MSSRSSFSRRDFLAISTSLAAGATASAREAFPAVDMPAWKQTTDRKIRIGIVGGGFGRAFHWHEHPNCEVAAVSDLLPDRLEQLQKTYRCDKTYPSLEELVQDDNIEAVAVFTEATNHVQHTIACMEQGKHVIAAVPACVTLEEAAQLKEVVERTGLTYMNAETSYYRWPAITARRLVRDGVLGPIRYCEGEYYHPAYGAIKSELSAARDGRRTWRYGFPPMWYPTHATAYLVGVTGERLLKVSCIGYGDPDEPALQDNEYGNPFSNCMAMFLTSSGTPFRCNIGWDMHAHTERAQWFGSKGSYYMESDSGQPNALSLRGRNGLILDSPDYWHMVPETMRYDTGHGASHPFLTHEFIMALLEERAPAVDLYQSLAYCVPGIVAQQSALEGGKQLDVPSFDRPDRPTA